MDELAALRDEASSAVQEADAWRGKGVALGAQLDASDRALDATKARCKVLERQVQQRDDGMGAVKRQLAAMHDSRCAALSSQASATCTLRHADTPLVACAPL